MGQVQRIEPEVYAACNTIAATVYSVSRGMRGKTITVQMETPHGFASVSLPAACVRQFAPGDLITLTISAGA